MYTVRDDDIYSELARGLHRFTVTIAVIIGLGFCNTTEDMQIRVIAPCRTSLVYE